MGWAFPIGVDSRTGKIKTTNLSEDIKQSIIILLNTTRGERLKHSSYGTDLNRFVFEPISYSLIREIKEEINSSLNYWEKRIKNVEVNVLNDVEEETQLLINITYDIKETGEREEINYEYNLLSEIT